MEETGGSYGRRDDWLAEAGLEGGVGRLLSKELVPAELQTNGLILERAGRTKVTDRRLIGNLERRTDWDVNGR